jgi:hypothetical protein
MADTTNSLNFWTSIAETYKSYPNVLFELFNEPYMCVPLLSFSFLPLNNFIGMVPLGVKQTLV